MANDNKQIKVSFSIDSISLNRAKADIRGLINEVKALEAEMRKISLNRSRGTGLSSGISAATGGGGLTPGTPVIQNAGANRGGGWLTEGLQVDRGVIKNVANEIKLAVRDIDTAVKNSVRGQIQALDQLRTKFSNSGMGGGAAGMSPWSRTRPGEAYVGGFSGQGPMQGVGANFGDIGLNENEANTRGYFGKRGILDHLSKRFLGVSGSELMSGPAPAMAGLAAGVAVTNKVLGGYSDYTGGQFNEYLARGGVIGDASMRARLSNAAEIGRANKAWALSAYGMGNVDYGKMAAVNDVRDNYGALVNGAMGPQNAQVRMGKNFLDAHADMMSVGGIKNYLLQKGANAAVNSMGSAGGLGGAGDFSLIPSMSTVANAMSLGGNNNFVKQFAGIIGAAQDTRQGQNERANAMIGSEQAKDFVSLLNDALAKNPRASAYLSAFHGVERLGTNAGLRSSNANMTLARARAYGLDGGEVGGAAQNLFQWAGTGASGLATRVALMTRAGVGNAAQSYGLGLQYGDQRYINMIRNGSGLDSNATGMASDIVNKALMSGAGYGGAGIGGDYFNAIAAGAAGMSQPQQYAYLRNLAPGIAAWDKDVGGRTDNFTMATNTQAAYQALIAGGKYNPYTARYLSTKLSFADEIGAAQGHISAEAQARGLTPEIMQSFFERRDQFANAGYANMSHGMESAKAVKNMGFGRAALDAIKNNKLDSFIREQSVVLSDLKNIPYEQGEALIKARIFKTASDVQSKGYGTVFGDKLTREAAKTESDSSVEQEEFYRDPKTGKPLLKKAIERTKENAGFVENAAGGVTLQFNQALQEVTTSLQNFKIRVNSLASTTSKTNTPKKSG